MTKAIDLIGAAGICAVGVGFYLWRPCFALIFAGAALLWVARTLAAEEKPREGK